jgi:AcrR family transcriptional regulator
MNIMGIVERREEEREQRREAIVRGALDLYVERGVDRSALADIAARVNLSRSLVYFYFGSKEGLLRSITAEGLRILLDGFSQAARRAESGLDGIHEIGRGYIAFAESHAGYYRAISAFQLMSTQTAADDDDESDRDLLAEIGRRAQAINRLLADQIERGQADGSIRKSISDPMATGLSLWFATTGLIQMLSDSQRVEGHNYTAAELFESGLGILRAGLST